MSPLPRLSSSPNRARPSLAGFTLLEVVLALGIALGLLAVVLFFYQQASRLRDATLANTATLAAVRLSMEHLATELRTAKPMAGSFRGGPQNLEFVSEGIADPANWTGSTNGGWEAAFPLLRIRYSLLPTNDAGGGGGLERVEEPYDSVRAQATTPNQDSGDATNATGDEAQFADLFGSNTPPYVFGDSNGLSMPVLGETNQASLSASTNLTVSVDSGSSVIVPGLRYFQLRYWDGTSWLDSWTADTLPCGVEISLGTDAVAPEATPDSAPAEFFRRVIALPLSSGNSATNGETTASMGNGFAPALSGDRGP